MAQGKKVPSQKDKDKLKKTLKNIKNKEKFISRLLGLIVILVIGLLVFDYVNETKRPLIPQKVKEILLRPTSTKKSKEASEEKINAGKPTEYTVQKGDHLWKVAELNYGSGYNWIDIAKKNNIQNPNYIEVGTKLIIPDVEPKKLTVKKVSEVNSISGDFYQIQKNDNLWKIAVRAYGDGYQWPKIAQANNLADPSIIHPGNTLVIPR